MILSLCKLESDFIHSANHLHFKELQDNINEATELADSYREILYDLLNIFHGNGVDTGKGFIEHDKLGINSQTTSYLGTTALTTR
jgi:hypothetical protein